MLFYRVCNLRNFVSTTYRPTLTTLNWGRWRRRIDLVSPQNLVIWLDASTYFSKIVVILFRQHLKCNIFQHKTSLMYHLQCSLLISSIEPWNVTAYIDQRFRCDEFMIVLTTQRASEVARFDIITLYYLIKVIIL